MRQGQKRTSPTPFNHLAFCLLPYFEVAFVWVLRRRKRLHENAELRVNSIHQKINAFELLAVDNIFSCGPSTTVKIGNKRGSANAISPHTPLKNVNIVQRSRGSYVTMPNSQILSAHRLHHHTFLHVTIKELACTINNHGQKIRMCLGTYHLARNMDIYPKPNRCSLGHQIALASLVVRCLPCTS